MDELKIYKKINKGKSIDKVIMADSIHFEDWSKLDLRVAEIEKAEEIDGADKLYKLSLDVGELGKRTICAGIKQYYPIRELVGKKIIYFANLKSRKMKGVESQGMLLAASTEDNSQVILLCPEKEIANGSRVG